MRIKPEPKYSSDMSRWQEVVVPPKADKEKHDLWFRRANAARFEWRVFLQNGTPHARLFDKYSELHPEWPHFSSEVRQGYYRPSSVVRVGDGWLVGYNRGEWGGALFWFSPDGKRKYKISNHQIVDFITTPNGIRAIEGLTHMGISQGSLIRIARPTTYSRWQATVERKLPFAPMAISRRRNGDLLILLTDALVSVGTNRSIHTLVSTDFWKGLYPNSSLLIPNEQKLYIGMRQFVGEIDMRTKRLRFLVPSSTFLNKLTVEEQALLAPQCRVITA